jgi:hypothetical protein
MSFTVLPYLSVCSHVTTQELLNGFLCSLIMDKSGKKEWTPKTYMHFCTHFESNVTHMLHSEYLLEGKVYQRKLVERHILGPVHFFCKFYGFLDN